MKTLLPLVVTSLLLVTALAGCSSAATTSSKATPTARPTTAMSSAQAQELADGTVTYDEYKAAFRRYVACDAKAGYKVAVNGETNEVINYFVPAPAVDSGADDRCQQREFFAVDTKWQISREDTSPQAADYSKCLIRAGITPKATEAEKFHQLQAAHLDPTACYVSDGAVSTPTPNP